jgi:hypothetical protein
VAAPNSLRVSGAEARILPDYIAARRCALFCGSTGTEIAAGLL